MTASNTRILYVGSDPEFCDSIRAVFNERSAEFVCTFAITGKQALELAEAQKFDLLISEYGLYDMTGDRLCRKIRERDGSTPLLIYASVYRDSDHEAATNSGANAYILKSDGTSNLVSAIRRLTRRPEPTTSRYHATRSLSIL
ncbi:MAG: response regulator [Acidobacteriota bacterium]